MASPKRILIVEDDTHIAELMGMHLRDEGYAVERAADGDAGAQLLERGQWDALVLDLMLPGIDGLEICRRARSMARYTPIIAAKEQKIVAEFATVQGKLADIGGYYKADSEKVKAVMRPSPTFNAAIAAVV
jgi:CheY-like chemotaxis protein